MRKFVHWLLPLLLLLGSHVAEASHIAAADLSYRCLGGNQYEITLRVFTDCQGISAPRSAGVQVQSIGICSAPSQNVTLTRTSNREVPIVCAAQAGLSACTNPGSGFIGYEESVYVGTTDLSAYVSANCGWTISYQNCCGNPAITNIANATSSARHIEVNGLSNAVASSNSSPYTNGLPTLVICDVS